MKKVLEGIIVLIIVLLIIPAAIVEGIMLLCNVSFAQWYSNKYWNVTNHHSHIIYIYMVFGLIIYSLLIPNM